LEVFAIEEDAEDDASNDKFSSTGDVAFVDFDTSFACLLLEAAVVVLEFSTRESLSGMASENHKFFP